MSFRKFQGQLVQGKNLCDRRLDQLGYHQAGKVKRIHNRPSKVVPGMSDSEEEASAAVPLNTTGGSSSSLSFAAIMNSPFSRRYFYRYLEEQSKGCDAPPYQDLLGFWTSVEELKASPRTLWHQLATEIFYTYINKPSGAVKLGKKQPGGGGGDLKRIESFLMGDSDGPEVFYEIQQEVWRKLEDNHYPAFLVSEACYRMLEDDAANENNDDVMRMINADDDDDEAGGDDVDDDVRPAGAGNQGDPSSRPFKDLDGGGQKVPPVGPADSSFWAVLSGSDTSSSGYAKSYLEHMGERLQNKTQALKALKSSVKPDSKVLKMLKGEVDKLKEDRHEVEQHLIRTESWSRHLSKWRCQVQSVDHLEDQDLLQVSVIVYVPARMRMPAQQPVSHRAAGGGGGGPDPAADEDDALVQQQVPTSWACVRKFQDFHALHRELTPYVSWMKDMPELPSGSKSFFRRRGSNKQHSSKAWQDKARAALQRYVDTILADDRLNKSEIVYSFLNPSPDHLKAWTSTSGGQRSRRHRWSASAATPPSLSSTVGSAGSDVTAAGPDNRGQGQGHQIIRQRRRQQLTSSISNFFKGDPDGDGGGPDHRSDTTRMSSSSSGPPADPAAATHRNNDINEDSTSEDCFFLEDMDRTDLGRAAAFFGSTPGAAPAQSSGTTTGVLPSGVPLPPPPPPPTQGQGLGPGPVLAGHDAIAEPLYALIEEVFNLRGVFKILRKSLMTFVQITYGSTISRQIRELVSWATSDVMVIHYLHSFRTTFWRKPRHHRRPEGGVALKRPRATRPEVAANTTTTTEETLPLDQEVDFPEKPDDSEDEEDEDEDEDEDEETTGQRSEADKVKTREEVRRLLLQNIPEVLVNLVGQQAARNGTAKVFESLQNKTLNKQLCYDFLELLCSALFPELLQSYAAQQLNNYVSCPY